MTRISSEQLPKAILERASLSGNEYAWHINDIPKVIEAARAANLVSIGGQLQFRIPEEYGGGTCECYWIEVDTYRSVSKELPWDERVKRSASNALVDFKALQSKFDFLKEGRDSFGKYLTKAEELGGKIDDMMCFVWYVTNAKEEAALQTSVSIDSLEQ